MSVFDAISSVGAGIYEEIVFRLVACHHLRHHFACAGTNAESVTTESRGQKQAWHRINFVHDRHNIGHGIDHSAPGFCKLNAF